MPYAPIANLKALGKYNNANQLDAPSGSMTVASNVVIRRPEVVESRRGFKIYGNSFGGGTDTLKTLFTYKNTIIRHFLSTLQYDDGAGNFSSFSGSYSQPDDITRIHAIESNNNLYFTTSEGVKKISALTDADIPSSPVTNAGGIKAIDFNVRIDKSIIGNETGILPQNSVAAYRTLWGIKDSNNNLIYGSPSQSITVENQQSSLQIKDLINLCLELDSFAVGSLMDEKDYSTVIASQLSFNSSASQIKGVIGGNTVNLCTKIDNDIEFAAAGNVTSANVAAGVCTINFDTAGGVIATDRFIENQKVILDGWTPNGGTTQFEKYVTLYDIGGGGNTAKFVTAATAGAVTISGSQTMRSYEFRYIYNYSSQGTTPDSLANTPILTPPTTNQLDLISSTMQRILTALTGATFKDYAISPSNKALISSLLTTTSDVYVDVSIPQEVVDASAAGIYYFFQVYRTQIRVGLGTDVLDTLISDFGVPGDECFLIYEAFPSSTEITNKRATFKDVTPDSLKGVALYTNGLTGEGILQANEAPPACTDINKYKNVTFYSNTRTRHRKALNLSSVEGLNTDVDAGRTVNLSIVQTNGISNNYVFTQGKAQVVTTTLPAANALYTNGNPADYIVCYPANSLHDGVSANDYQNSLNPVKYVVWYYVKNASYSVQPVISADYSGQEIIYVKVPLDFADTGSIVATKTKSYLSEYTEDFTVSAVSALLTITNVDYGYAGAPIFSDHLSGSTPTVGAGQKSTTKQILLYPATGSPALAVDLTARSIVSVINKNSSEVVYGYYTSGTADSPGSFTLEAKSLSINQFFVSLNTNTSTVSGGNNFTPSLTPETYISAINPATDEITIAKVSGVSALSETDFTIGSQIVVFGSDQGVGLDGVQTIIGKSGTFAGSNFKLKLNTNITTAVAKGSVTRASQVEASDNEAKSHRLYYSKLQQPEAVPLLNYFDVGASDKAILRIYPLRNSLFIFKEDGLFRVSGETTPFSQMLFDSNCNLIANETVSVTDNIIYCWTNQGISAVTESGTDIISRPIDYEILKLSSSQYTNFAKICWGLGYNSDNSYMVATGKFTTDTVPTIIYRFSTVTRTWTTYDKSNTCGLNNPADDKLYMGAGDVNYLEIERKNLDRTDFADREYTNVISAGQYDKTSGVLTLSSILNIEKGDTIIQDQYISLYQYNNLLQKIDIDPNIVHNYYSTLAISSGSNMRTSLVLLATKLNVDLVVSYFTPAIANISSGTITNIAIGNPVVITSVSHGLINGRVINISGSNSTPSIDGQYQITYINANSFSIVATVESTGTTGTFATQVNSDQDLQACFNGITALMNSNPTLNFSNYPTLSGTVPLEVTVTKVGIGNNKVSISPSVDFLQGSFMVYKSIECTIVYSPNTFGDPLSLKQVAEATIMFEDKAFSTASISFSTDLVPSFKSVDITGDGKGLFGFDKFGSSFFGGGSNSIPFRTYIPRDSQRCRYTVVKFAHKVARERFAVYGITLLSRSISNRAYRR